MAQTAKECLSFLAEAGEAVEELSVIVDREKTLEADEQRLGHALDAEKKSLEDTVRTTVKKRREEIESSYDAEITKAQEQLKKARGKREKAKNQGVKERIAEETAQLHEENKELRGRMKAVFREHHAPAFCRSRLYYSLYAPRWAKEILALLLFVAIVFLALPCGVYLLLPEHKTFYLAGIYLADILVFGGKSATPAPPTPPHHAASLRAGRKIQDQIYANNKKIKVITATIRKDRSESLYDLEKYDDEIARLNQELNEVMSKKKEALNNFESVTKNILRDELEHNHKEKLDSLQTAYHGVREQLQATAAEVKQKRLQITDCYGSHLGREFLEPSRIEALKAIIESGRASNISEAIEVYRNKN